VADLPVFEPYLTLRRLERGASYELFLARHGSLQRSVWIKALRSEVPLSSSVARRLEREGEILARLHHEGILGILDCVRRTPRLWLVLEAVDGWSLAEALAAARRSSSAALEVSGAVALALGIARALEHAHGAGVVHAALQPEHVLISRAGAVKLSGFSALLAEGPEAEPLDTEPGASEGAYLSPEQVLGERADERSDLFSLGVILYELLTGRHPFRGSNERTSTQAIRHAPPEPLRSANPEVSPELERIVLRCLEKAPERRFDALSQLVRALEHVLGAEALADPGALVLRALARSGLAAASALPAQRPRSEELERRAARRGLRHSLTGLLGASLLLLLGGAVLSAWLELERPRRTPASEAWAPENGGELLVVADPWAHVIVDGARLETTPFATPLKLGAGEHFVRLEHPQAPAERRRVELAAGQRIVLEVTMRLTPGRGDAGVDDLRWPDASSAPP
jgi:eukaryotic-like serine/threonine-protein kinase